MYNEYRTQWSCITQLQVYIDPLGYAAIPSTLYSTHMSKVLVIGFEAKLCQLQPAMIVHVFSL